MDLKQLFLNIYINSIKISVFSLDLKYSRYFFLGYMVKFRYRKKLILKVNFRTNSSKSL